MELQAILERFGIVYGKNKHPCDKCRDTDKTDTSYDFETMHPMYQGTDLSPD